MLCPRFSSPLVDPLWPLARSLWPETRPLHYNIEREFMRSMQEMRHNMEYMERLHQRIFEQIDQSLPSPSSGSASFGPVAVETLSGHDGAFALSLDTSDFSPEELSVKQVGRKLRVSGKTEKKKDDGKGSFSYRCQEFRQELDLPPGVEPETVSCSLVGGRLHITAPQNKALEAGGQERVVPINVEERKPAAIQNQEEKEEKN